MGHGKRLAMLRDAQGRICAGCGRPLAMQREGKRSRNFPYSLTFDHVIPRHQGGTRSIDNGLAKHRACNAKRADNPPTGCDHIWQAVVYARLGLAS